MSATDLLQDLAGGLFVIVFLVVSVTAARHPRRATFDSALLFGAVALILGASAALATLHLGLRADVAAFGDTLVMVLPYLLLRLADDFTPVPRRWKTLGLWGCVLASVGFILAAQPPGLPAVLRLVWAAYIVIYFVACTGYVALTFVRAARPARGVTKRRLQAVGVGSVCLAMLLVVDGASTVWPAHLAVWQGLNGVFLLGCGVCYVLGFAPPGWLRRAWQAPELRAFVGQTARLPYLPTTQAIAGALEEGAAAALGVSHAAIGLWDAHERVLRFAPSATPVDPAAGHTLAGQVFTTQRALYSDDVARDNPDLAAEYRAAGVAAMVVVPLTAGEQTLGVLCAYASRPSLFIEDDLALAQLLAGQAAVVLQGRALSDAVAQRSAQLEEAVTALEAQIAERERAEAALQQSNTALARASQVKSEFLANMSHELRTPLNAIIGFSEVLQDETFGALNTRQQRYVGNVLQSGRHLLALVNDILDLSKVEAGRMELHVENLELAPLLAEMCESILPLAQTKNVALHNVPGDGAPRVLADRARVVQILYNLLSNALKFTPDGGMVTLTWTAGPDAVAIAVADTGIGIAPENHARVFEEFQQIDSTIGRSQQGTGLGLALTKRLVELHGGTIALQSAPGAGSTFTVTLPHVREEPPMAPVGGTRGDVLVVEDNRGAYELLSLYVSEAGYGVQWVQHVAEVVPRARALRPVAITLDILLQEETGWLALEQLHADPRTREIPVVIVSVVDEPATGFALGASAYLVKPVARHDLLDTLGRVVNADAVAAGGKRRVLAVDDQLEALELIGLALEGSPYEVLRATSGVEALQLLTRERPDALIVDLMMASLSGFDVIDAVVASPQTRDIPIIVLTAHELTDADVARLNGHVAATLSKRGFDKEGLLRELRRVTLRAGMRGGDDAP